MDVANTYTCIPDEKARAQGLALLRIASDLHHFFDGDPDVPADFWRDVATMEAAGRTLSAASIIPLSLGIHTVGVPTADARLPDTSASAWPTTSWPTATGV